MGMKPAPQPGMQGYNGFPLWEVLVLIVIGISTICYLIYRYVKNKE